MHDLQSKTVYCSLSQRADKSVLDQYMTKLRSSHNFYKDFESVSFHSFDSENSPIYHTDVVISVLSDHVLVCSEAIKDDQEREKVIQHIINSGKEPVHLSY